VARQRATDEDAARRIGNLIALPDLDAAHREPDVVIEAVPERIELKQQVLARAEALDPALLASNTSALSIGTLARVLQTPERFIGLHFFNPVHAMPLVEVVRGSGTAEATVTAAVKLVERVGKEPVIVRDHPGFATSRLGVLLGLEAIRMVEQGVAAPSEIDRAMELGYGHPMGPLRLGDLVGLDVRLAIAKDLEATYGERFTPPRLLVEMVDRGDVGKKAGRGFYEWA
jgi:3-hydroxybutyryl-CoA dehydrogenase